MLWCLRTVGKVTRTKVGKRKLRLFACGCCRLAWGQMHDPRLREAVEVAERFAEGRATKGELEAARSSVGGLAMGRYEANAPGVRERTAARMAEGATAAQAFSAAFGMTALPVPLAGYAEEVPANATLCGLVRCVFGNPFAAPPRIDPAWLAWNDGLVKRLARGIYEERAFNRMPLLADALLDASCDNEELLRHCREPGPHARGCWVLDLLFGKE
jgi:hypothetical protein